MNTIYDNIELRVERSNLNEYLGKNKAINYINPLVTVDVITYQHADYIEQCLQSILRQVTEFQYEIIIGEDESTDGTREICMQYAEKYPDIIRLFLRERKDVIYWYGVPSGTFNSFANKAVSRGKYIAICEGDDYWIDPHKLQKQVDYMENNPGCTLCTHAAEVVDKYGHKKKEKRPDVGDKIITIETAINRRNREATSSFLFLKSIIDINAWPVESPMAPYSDTPLYILCAYHGFIKYMDVIMSAYRRGSSSSAYSIMSKKSKDLQLSFIIGKINIYDEFDKYSKGMYKTSVSKRKLFYVKRYLKLIKKGYLKRLPEIIKLLRSLTIKYRILAYLHVFIIYPFYRINKGLKKYIKK